MTHGPGKIISRQISYYNNCNYLIRTYILINIKKASARWNIFSRSENGLGWWIGASKDNSHKKMSIFLNLDFQIFYKFFVLLGEGRGKILFFPRGPWVSNTPLLLTIKMNKLIWICNISALSNDNWLKSSGSIKWSHAFNRHLPHFSNLRIGY